jgi:alpha-1,2-mannosyltransferase
MTEAVSRWQTQLGALRSGATPERLTAAAWLAAVAVCIVAAARSIMAFRHAGADSWFAMERALDYLHGHLGAQSQVYQALLFTQHIKFQYPPTGLLLLDALRLGGIDQYSEFNFINALLLILTSVAFAVLAVRILGELSWRGMVIPLAPLAFLLALKFYPDRFAYALGQMQVLLSLLFVLACLAVLSGRQALAGVLIAAAATVKPQFLVFGAVALWRRDWRFLAAFALTTAIAVILSGVAYGWQTLSSYYHDVLPYLSQHGECYHTNQSVNGVLNRWAGPPCIDMDPQAVRGSPVVSSWFPPYNRSVYLATLLSSLALLLLPFVLRPTSDRVGMLLSFCLCGTLFTLASPIAWVHHYDILLPAYLVAAKIAIDDGRNWPSRVQLMLLGLSLLLAGMQLADPFAPTDPTRNLIQSHVFLGVCLLVVVLVLQMLARRPRASRPGALITGLSG